MLHQLFFQYSPRLNEQAAVNGFVGHAQALVIGIASDPLSVLIVGTIEEGAKIIGVMLIARRRRPVSEVDGLIMGAAVGMGFAALESMGYTFTEFLTSQGSLSATVITMLV